VELGFSFFPFFLNLYIHYNMTIIKHYINNMTQRYDDHEDVTYRDTRDDYTR